MVVWEAEVGVETTGYRPWLCYLFLKTKNRSDVEQVFLVVECSISRESGTIAIFLETLV